METRKSTVNPPAADSEGRSRRPPDACAAGSEVEHREGGDRGAGEALPGARGVSELGGRQDDEDDQYRRDGALETEHPRCSEQRRQQHSGQHSGARQLGTARHLQQLCLGDEHRDGHDGQEEPRRQPQDATEDDRNQHQGHELTGWHGDHPSA